MLRISNFIDWNINYVWSIIFFNFYLELQNDENAVVSITFGTAVIYNIFDIYMVMYLGNEIMLSSDRLSHCLFESNWIDQSISYKKCLLILIENLRQPHQLVGYKLYALNLDTFTSVRLGLCFYITIVTTSTYFCRS